ncbi:MAG: YdiU family protein [Robiginitomaculum sp.]|nr:YdiU family protein [Robiginitomaculum sp.]
MNNSYQPSPKIVDLGNGFLEPVSPASFKKTELRYFNQRAARQIGLDDLSEQQKIDYFAKFEPLPDNQQQPLAMAYHGHQFASYNPDLGDGRGFLYAQLRDNSGKLLDLGTKGSGQTPWSRSGDGKLTLKGAVREILATEMLEALGVSTSKSFCVFETGDQLWRNDEPSPARSAVLTRLSHSNIRFGSFQRLAYFNQVEEMRALLNHIAGQYMPHLQKLDPEILPMAFLSEVATNSADLCASWMAAGFVHGVLNTDNMNINGESFDYGPWRFLPSYDPKFTAAYFDTNGLYAYERQAEAVSWNLARLGEALSILAPVEQLQLAHKNFAAKWEIALPEAFLRRLGLRPKSQQHDKNFLQVLSDTLLTTQLPFEGFFFDWFCGDEGRALTRPNLAVYNSSQFSDLRKLLNSYQPDRPKRLQHKYFAAETPQTLLIDQVGSLWQPIAQNDDWQEFEQVIMRIDQARLAYDIFI